MFKKLTVGILTLGLALALAGCGGADKKAAAPAGAAEVVVNLKNTKFGQEKVEVKAGTTVKWVNQDTVDHSVWEGEPDSGKQHFNSGDLSTGKEFKHTFDKAGTYEIYCNTGAHHLIGMKMQVVVQ